MFRLIIVDIDGVMTNGTKFYDQNHKVIAKQFNDRDFTAIKRFKAAGFLVAFVSADPWNATMAKERNVDFWDVRQFAPNLDKSLLLPAICESYCVDKSQICYVGDDFYDNTLLFDVGFKFCPADACYATQVLVGQDNVITRPGGAGVIDSLFQWAKINYNFEEKYPDDNL